jgi:hypothetical protein
MGHRTDLRTISDLRINDQAIISNLDAAADPRIDNPRSRTYLASISDPGSALYRHARLYHRIAAYLSQLANIRRCGIDKRNSVIKHQTPQSPAIKCSLKLRKLQTVIHTLDFERVTVLIDRDVLAVGF